MKKLLAAAASAVVMSACGGGGGGSSSPSAGSFTLGGTLSGLAGSGLVLQSNAGGSLAVTANGGFTFTGGVASGSSYSIAVATQPSSPTQVCTVANGSGTVGSANITNIAVNCVTTVFTTLTNQPPQSGYLAILLTDGGVMLQSNADAGVFFKLTPDINGSYVNGSWRRQASPPAGYAPYAGAQAVLADGRVLSVGGEYNQNQYALPFAPSGLTNMSALYDPVADAWTMIPPPPGVAYIGDPAATVLPDGSFMFGTKLGRQMWRLDPAGLTWSALAATGKADDFAEEGLTLLPNGTLFTIDVGNPLHAEHYDPATARWYSDAPPPAGMTSPTDYPGGLTYGPAPLQVVGGITYGPGPAGTYFPPGEIGPAVLLPDGRVFVTGAAASGATAHTAIYSPAATTTAPGSVSAGPDFPAGDEASDSSAALLPSGHVLIAVPSGRFYEFDGSALNLAGTLSNNGGNTAYFLLPLPNGQILVTGGVTRLYDGNGSANPAWAPTITATPTSVTRGASFAISGTQFNGLSQAASVGDEFNSATNYPLVRIRNNASGHVFYARTHGHSSMGVATGGAVVSTSFDVPAGAETGSSSLVVIANGIASSAVTVTVN